MNKALHTFCACALVAIGIGCASSDHRHSSYRRVNEPVVIPGPVVVTPAPGAVVTAPTVVTTPPTTVVVPAITENQAVQIARAEAARQGWRNVTVSQTGYWNDRWHVDLYNQPHRHVENYGWVDISPSGQVLQFSRSRHHHAARPYYHRY